MFKIILGCPGTGKTTKLLSIVDYETSKNQVSPDQIAFVSFTKKAATEALNRAVAHFACKADQFPYFRTLHSLAFAAHGIDKTGVMGSSHFYEISMMLGLEFSDMSLEEMLNGNMPRGRYNGDWYVYVYGFARNRQVPYEDAWNLLNSDEPHGDWMEFRRFVMTMEKYKKKHGLRDFADLLDTDKVNPLAVKVVIIDEAQDLSTAQWQFATAIFSKAERVYIAGDDDQAIFAWAGADVSQFMTLQGDIEVLPQSYRIPRAVHRLAEEIAGRISQRRPKTYLPRDEEGTVQFHSAADQVDLTEGKWLLLCRNIKQMKYLTQVCQDAGVYYTYKDGTGSVNKSHIKAILGWELYRKEGVLKQKEEDKVNEFLDPRYYNIVQAPRDKYWHEVLTGIPMVQREYYISLLRRGEKLTRAPRVHINTIHSVKGGEADNVLLLTDMQTRTYNAMLEFPDAEHRVWYVGATRAKEQLHVVLPQSKYGYDI